MSADGKSLFGAAGGVGGATASLAASASSQGNANTNPASALMAAGLPFSALQHHAQLLQHTHHLQQQQHPHLLARNAGGTGSGLTVFQQEQLLQHQLLQQQQQRLLQHLQGGSHASVTQPQLVLEHWVQCDACNKWRRAPTQITSDKWFCRMNTWAPQFASCDVPEEPDPAAEGALEILGPGAAGNGGGGGGAVVEPQPQTGAGGTKRHRSAGGGRGGGSRGRAKAAKAAGNTANLSGGTGGGLKEELRDTEGGGGSLEDDTGGGGSTSSGGGAEGNFQSAKNSPVNMFSVVQQLASRVGGAARALQASPQSAGQTGIKQLPGRSASIGGGSGMSSHSATAQFAAALALEQQRLIQEGAREGLSALPPRSPPPPE
ncbi:cw-type zinc finger protein, partial [Cystoisospora suis]